MTSCSICGSPRHPSELHEQLAGLLVRNPELPDPEHVIDAAIVRARIEVGTRTLRTSMIVQVATHPDDGSLSVVLVVQEPHGLLADLRGITELHLVASSPSR